MHNKRKDPKREEFNRKYGWYLILCLGLMFAISGFFTRNLGQGETPIEITYQEFLDKLEAGEVDGIYYSPTEDYMTVTLYNDDTRSLKQSDRMAYQYPVEDQRIVIYPAYEEFRKDMLAAGATVTRVDTANWSEYMPTLVSAAFSIAMLVMLFNMMKGRGVFGPENKLNIVKTSDVRFSDVIGQDEILDDLRFIVELIKNPKKGDAVGAKIPKGLLLSGPPGTGKTLIAKAIAGEAGVPFLQQSGSNFIEMFVGVGAKRVRELFETARKNAPCIIFIDEIDAIGGARDNARNTSEHEQTINALLEQMDGFQGREGIFVIAATNRPDKLDKALTRPGRFDRQVLIAPPRDWEVRKELFDHYLKKFAVSDDVDVENLSRQTAGFTGADIAAICNEASMVAVMAEKKAVDMACIEEAIDKKIFKGNRSKKDQYQDDRKVVAYHEAGHAVMNWLVGEPISRASIQSTVTGVGGVVFGADKDTLFRRKTDYVNRILICYAGRASEEIKFGDPTTGASNDITQATEAMKQYVEHLGFSEELGLLDVGVLAEDHLVDSALVTDQMSAMSKKLYKECKDKLTASYEKVELLAQALLDKETLSGSQIEYLMETGELPAGDAPAEASA